MCLSLEYGDRFLWHEVLGDPSVVAAVFCSVASADAPPAKAALNSTQWSWVPWSGPGEVKQRSLARTHDGQRVHGKERWQSCQVTEEASRGAIP